MHGRVRAEYQYYGAHPYPFRKAREENRRDDRSNK